MTKADESICQEGMPVAFRDRRRQENGSFLRGMIQKGHSPLACIRLMASRTCGGDRHALFSPAEVKDWVQRHTAPCLKRSRQENPSSPAVSGQTVWCSKNLSQNQKFNPHIIQLTTAKPRKQRRANPCSDLQSALVTFLCPPFSEKSSKGFESPRHLLPLPSQSLLSPALSSNADAATLRRPAPWSVSSHSSPQVLPCGLHLLSSSHLLGWLLPCPLLHDGVLSH